MRIVLILMMLTVLSYGARLKDMGKLDGLQDQHLVGYGLVVGLAGSGDGTQSSFTIQTTLNMLRNMGIEIPNERIRLRNVAAVMVTATLKPFNKRGAKVDVSISSMGDARSLEGGTLLMTPLIGEDQEVYIMAQGALSVGGTSVSSPRGKASYRKNQPLSGQIPNGGIIKKELMSGLDLTKQNLQWSLNEPDFSSAQNVAQALQDKFGPTSAMAIDAATIKLNIPDTYKNNPIAYLSEMERVEFKPSIDARVILNEKTGTVVAGSNVKLDQVAVSHGNISIEINSSDSTSQPNPFSTGMTQSVINEQLSAKTKDNVEMQVIPTISNVGELASALNNMGVAPRDIIVIFQAIKKAGALHADLIIM
jgi:flagellar P-ring protein precursor FlgI